MLPILNLIYLFVNFQKLVCKDPAVEHVSQNSERTINYKGTFTLIVACFSDFALNLKSIPFGLISICKFHSLNFIDGFQLIKLPFWSLISGSG